MSKYKMSNSNGLFGCYTERIMPIFTLIRVVVSRIIIGIVVLLTALGLGSVSNSPSNSLTQEDPTQKIGEVVFPVEEMLILPRETSAPPKENATKEDKPKTDEVETFTEETEGAETAVDLPADRQVEAGVSSAGEEDPAKEMGIEISTTSPIPDSDPTFPFAQINTKTTETLVNVLCSQNTTGAVTPITGSGVIIDPRGIVITNAHVAQFFLLKDFPTVDSLKCILRIGSPARSIYTAELLYISPEWIRLHASDITSSEPRGTGEHDYAFLRITGRTNPNAELPATFPFVPIDINDQDIKTGTRVLLSAYPAGFLGNISIHKDLYSVSSIATVGERFTFLENTVDLFSVGGTVVSQGGSSGGAVVSDKNKLIGIIVTSTQADTTAERDLRAITLGHINRALFENANTTIEGLLFGDLALKAKLFNLSIAPTLTDLFLEYLVR